MNRKPVTLASLALSIAAALTLASGRVASAAKDNSHKPALHQADCTHVATATDVVGFAVLEMDSSGELQVQVSLKHGMPRTEYKAYLLAAPCQVVFTGDILSTNRKGKGNIHLMVPAASIPAGAKVAVQLVSPPTATVPGTGPFTDMITSDFVTPMQGSGEADGF